MIYAESDQINEVRKSGSAMQRRSAKHADSLVEVEERKRELVTLGEYNHVAALFMKWRPLSLGQGQNEQGSK